MLFSSAFLPVIGLLLSVGDLSRSIKLFLLGVLAATFIYDLQHTKRRTASLRNIPHLVVIILFQALLSFSWIAVYFTKPIGLDISRFMLVILAGFPWIVIWQAVSTTPQSPRIFGISPCGIGVIAWACSTTVLNKLGIGADSTMLTYGGTVEGAVLGQFRTILPGFAGIVPGGVFCGLSLAFSIAGMLLANNVLSRIAYIGASAVAAYGIFVTDVRSAVGAAVCVAILGGAYSLSRRGRAEADTTNIAHHVKKMVLLSAFLPLLVPLVVPPLDSLTENVSNSFITGRLLRSSSESLFSFAGRSQIWRLSLDLASSGGLSLMAFNPVGEYGAGVSDSLYDAFPMPGTAESAHSHNTALNFYYSFGMVGLGVFVYLIVRMRKALADQPLNQGQLALLLPFFSIMAFMSVESLLSVTYTYFGMFFTLFNLDIFRESQPCTTPRL